MEKTMEMKSTDDGRRLDGEIEKACASVSRTGAEGARERFLAEMARISAEWGPEATCAACRAHVISITAGGSPAWSAAQLDRLCGALQSLIDAAASARRSRMRLVKRGEDAIDELVAVLMALTAVETARALAKPN